MSWAVSGQERLAPAISNTKAINGLYSGQATRDGCSHRRNIVTHKTHCRDDFGGAEGAQNNRGTRSLTHNPGAQNEVYKPLGAPASISAAAVEMTSQIP